MAGQDWTEAEIRATVRAYLGMLGYEQAGRPINKAEVRRSLVAGPLAGRSEGSVEFRMRNISTVLEAMGRRRISGYMPAKNVGPTNEALIARLIKSLDKGEKSAPQPGKRAPLVLHPKPGSLGKIERLSSQQQRAVTPAHIHNAVARLLAGDDAPNFAVSRDYDVLLEDGTRLPPKKVFGLALEEALGIEAFPGHFSAGWSQPCFEIIERAGYRIVAKTALVPTHIEVTTAFKDMPPPPEDRAAVEGNIKLASHMRKERAQGLSKSKKAAFIAEHGRLFCERCGMDPVEVYGSALGIACIEVHHDAVQVKDMTPGHVTTLEDLRCLCANCHRVVHRELASII